MDELGSPSEGGGGGGSVDGGVTSVESAIVRIKEKYWTAKQLLCEKLGLEPQLEDEASASGDSSGSSCPSSEDDRVFVALLGRFRGLRGNTAGAILYNI